MWLLRKPEKFCFKEYIIVLLSNETEQSGFDLFLVWNQKNAWVSKQNKSPGTVSYDEIKQKVITQANDYHRVKAYTP